MSQTPSETSTVKHEIFAEPTPLGLFGLAVGCAALVPIAFGARLTPQMLKTAAMFCLLFGAGGQFLAGMMALANKNLYGGTLFTTFSFNWVMNWWALDSLARGAVPDHHTLLATEVLFLVIFLVLTYGFGFYSKLLFLFLLDIDLMFVAKVAKGFTGTRSLDLPIAILTVALAAIALWIAFALLINPTAGRAVFPVPGPLFRAATPPSPPARPAALDLSVRQAIRDVLYRHWREQAFAALPFVELERQVQAKAGPHDLRPDLMYLGESGHALLVLGQGGAIESARLNAGGIDAHERQLLGAQAA